MSGLEDSATTYKTGGWRNLPTTRIFGLTLPARMVLNRWSCLARRRRPGRSPLHPGAAMSCAPVVDTDLLERTAARRARGATWEAVAADFAADPDELRRLVHDAGPAYRQLVCAARREVLDEATAEAILTLRRDVTTCSVPSRRGKSNREGISSGGSGPTTQPHS